VQPYVGAACAYRQRQVGSMAAAVCCGLCRGGGVREIRVRVRARRRARQRQASATPSATRHSRASRAGSARPSPRERRAPRLQRVQEEVKRGSAAGRVEVWQLPGREGCVGQLVAVAQFMNPRPPPPSPASAASAQNVQRMGRRETAEVKKASMPMPRPSSPRHG